MVWDGDHLFYASAVTYGPDSGPSRPHPGTGRFDPLQTFDPAHQIKTIPQLQVRLIAVKTRKKRVDFMVRLNFCFNRAEVRKPKRLV
jgi:hypothetical protein